MDGGYARVLGLAGSFVRFPDGNIRSNIWKIFLAVAVFFSETHSKPNNLSISSIGIYHHNFLNLSIHWKKILVHTVFSDELIPHSILSCAKSSPVLHSAITIIISFWSSWTNFSIIYGLICNSHMEYILSAHRFILIWGNAGFGMIVNLIFLIVSGAFHGLISYTRISHPL